MKKVLGLVVVVAAIAAGAWYVTRSPEGQKAATEAVTDAEEAAKAVTGAVEKGTTDSTATAAEDAAKTAAEAAAAATQGAGSLNLRGGPGTDFPVLAKIPAGAELTVLNRTGDWYVASYTGTIGFVSSAYVSILGA